MKAIKYIKDLWKTLGRSIYVGPRLKANLMALTGVSIVTALLGLVLIVMNVVQRDTVMLIPSILTFAGGVSCGLFAGVFKKRKIAAVIPGVFCTVMFTIYAVNGMAEGTAILWSLFMPLGLCYFVSVRYGIVLSIYHSALYAVLFYTPIKERMAAYYSPVFMARFPLVFTGLAAFTLLAMIQYHKSALFEIDYSEQLNAEVEKQTRAATERAEKLERLSDEVVETLARTIDAKDDYTNGHSFRVMEYSVLLAQELGVEPARITELRREALLHDIGKIGVPDSVLQKPSKLTDDEFETIKSHTTIGGKILSRYEDLKGAASAAVHHHERYDGRGYPGGLAGEEIPKNSRIISIADAFDAMNSSRVYRKALPRDVIRSELAGGRGKQFDPAFLDVFVRLMDEGKV
ncbi:MAG: HD-GYP domain-containing protein [Clostridia bacterium]|nr:HD-GYP domain-containing protein [Clostridia bacterium]